MCCWEKCRGACLPNLGEEEAYMQLVLCNTQSELHPLEEGKHAAESGMDLKAYAEAAGKARTTLSTKVKAWRVLAVTDIGHDAARDAWSNLAEIHAAPRWLWSALATKMAEESWTVQVTREKVAKVKDRKRRRFKPWACQADNLAPARAGTPHQHQGDPA